MRIVSIVEWFFCHLCSVFQFDSINFECVGLLCYQDLGPEPTLPYDINFSTQFSHLKCAQRNPISWTIWLNFGMFWDFMGVVWCGTNLRNDKKRSIKSQAQVMIFHLPHIWLYKDKSISMCAFIARRCSAWVGKFVSANHYEKVDLRHGPGF